MGAAALVVSWPVGWRLMIGTRAARLFAASAMPSAGDASTNQRGALDGALVLVEAARCSCRFITDAIGLLLLLPPSRAVARRIAARNHHGAWLMRVAN